MPRILVFTVLLAGLTAIATNLPSRAPAEQDTNKKPAVKQTPAVKEKPAVKDLPITAQSLVKALFKTVDFAGIEDPKETLLETLAQLARVHRVIFHVNERAFKYEMLNDVLKTEIANPNAVPAMKTTLGKVISRILERVSVPSGATFLVREDCIEITTTQFVDAEIRLSRKQPQRTNAGTAHSAPPVPGAGKGTSTKGKPGTPQEEREEDAFFLGKKFTVPPVSIAVERQPLEEALRQIRLQANINLVVDPGLGEKVKTALTITLLNAPLDSAVRVLLEMTELDSVWLDNIFYITSRDKAEKLRTTWPGRRSGGGKPIITAADGAAGGM
jgi:hypothetical protein